MSETGDHGALPEPESLSLWGQCVAMVIDMTVSGSMWLVITLLVGRPSPFWDDFSLIWGGVREAHNVNSFFYNYDPLLFSSIYGVSFLISFKSTPGLMIMKSIVLCDNKSGYKYIFSLFMKGFLLPIYFIMTIFIIPILVMTRKNRILLDEWIGARVVRRSAD
ncbi:MAG: hypothetical protein ACE363_13500 [Alphaproteobacteria bacterium]